MTTLRSYEDVLDNEQISSFFLLEEVQIAKEKIDSRLSGSVYFSLRNTDTIKSILKEKLGLDLSSATSVPMRWIKGDIAPHIDVGAKTFENTYLIYLTDSVGELLVDGSSYPITKGSAYVFPESLRHETINTGTEPRLLLGPMSEDGFAVGGIAGLYGDGATTIYIRQVDGNCEYSNDQTSWNIMYFPIAVTNTNTAAGVLTIDFVTDITLTTTSDYFVCTSTDIQFGKSSLKTDGTRPKITIEGVTNYPGLFQNGTSSYTGNNNIYIYNLEVNAINESTLNSSAGWFGQEYFGKAASGIYIINCSSDGLINDDAGGIVGNNSGGSNGSLTIIGCSSSGSIGINAGGIVGSASASASGHITCISCWSTGSIGSFSGGIVASFVRSATISNCYSTGTIGEYAGGICGKDSATTESGAVVTITACYSMGSIGATAGGIVGNNPASAGTVTVSNCYSTGNIASTGGGIGAVTSSGQTITNCYTVGSVTGGLGYIIGSSSTVPVTCYSEANTGTPGIWSSVHANTVLQGNPTSIVGTTWVATVSNQPYELLNMGYTPYTIANINTTSTPSLVRQYSSTFSAGNSTTAAIQSGKSYTILQITGGDVSSHGSFTISNSSTGVISTTTSSIEGVYTIYVRNTGSYHITTYIITITGSDSSDTIPIVSCCDKPAFRRGPFVDNATYIDRITGNVLLVNTVRKNLTYSDIMAIKRAQASKN